MLVLCFLLALIFATPVDALAWDDFANNLATDLAPLITLFGEQVTKQFLSESVGLLDNIIFAVAPLGILTAIVSAIRVQGSPSLRAFIGRAQEASGNAEVELLSSTSETTSELWHEGGIARVFGRPKILEVVRTARIDDGDYAHNNDGDCQAGIKLFNEACIGSASLWVQQNKASDQFDSEGSYESTPNLSFNIGIKKMPKAYKCGVATLGLTLQTGVLIFASLTAYHDPENFLIEEKPAENYGFPFVFSGTLLVSCGMFLCAYIIDKGSSEISYEQRCKKNSTIYWVQPGGQKIGDQIFESFVGLSNHHEYLRSSKRPRGNGKDYVVLWIAVISTIVGFVSQFVGLRAMHSSVIMAQLASTLIMAILRAALRTQRMDPTRNRLESYEMECMKRNMETVNMRNTTRQAPQKPYWFSWIMFNIKKVNGAREKRQPDFAGLRKHVQGHEMDFLAMDLEGIHSLYICIQPPEDQIQGVNDDDKTMSNIVRAVNDRARLTRLTQQDSSQSWQDLEVREATTRLHSALNDIINFLQLRLQDAGEETQRFDWNVCLQYTVLGADHNPGVLRQMFPIRFHGGSSSNFDYSELEALVGLWAWSLKNHNRRRKKALKNVRIIPLDSAHCEEDADWYKMWMLRGWKYEEGTDTSPATMENMGAQEDSELQLFGGSIAKKKSESNDAISALYMRTVNSTITMCAQDIFISFLSASLQTVGQLDSETIIRPSTTRPTSLSLQNSWIEELVDIFTENGLGSSDDAYMCVIPLLTRSSKMPQRNAGLFLAAENGYHEAVKTLVVKGANPNTKNKHGQFALHLATLNKHSNTVQALIENGSDLDVTDPGGSTALHLAATEEGTKNIVDVLTTKGATLDQENREGYTALHLAVEKCHVEIVELLIERGASVNAVTHKGRTALGLAVQCGHKDRQCRHKDIEIILKENGAELNEIDKNAISTSHHESPGKQSDIPADDKDGRTEVDPTTSASNSIVIPCHHIRIGDLLLLHQHVCQVIRITTSNQTGQHRYLGVDLFTKMIYEESSFMTNSTPSVEVQSMLGPKFKQYRLLDVKKDGKIVAMTETGDMKHDLRVLDQSDLPSRLLEVFDDGRGSIRVFVVESAGEEMVVDYRVVTGSRI